MKYSDVLIDYLVELGYTHCFFVGGGNVMHLLESARTRLKCLPVVHEVAASIAAEYFNAATNDPKNRAFAMVTAGPGVTNLVTGVAGAWLESRELLVIAGQARTDALSRGKVRQIGHQEIDAAGIMKPITKLALTIEEPLGFDEISRAVNISSSDRKGPVFLEFCLDTTAANIENPIDDFEKIPQVSRIPNALEKDIAKLLELLSNSKRPMFLFGGGLERKATQALVTKLNEFGVPIATTWNGSDRYLADQPLYAGRPNTYGMRSGNILIQQADLVIALGTRLGLQQTGFNWQKFVPVGKLVQVDIDSGELAKGTPNVDLAIQADANIVLKELLNYTIKLDLEEWRKFIEQVRSEIPLTDIANIAGPDFIEPFQFVSELNKITSESDQIIPCSSGGAFTTMMQAYELRGSQIMITNKGLASMGYGLSGAIGAAIANPSARTILTEGDGGFAQNYQELGTAALHKLNLKIFIYSNQGYASIRTMQKAYFNGNYIGCDAETGVGLPEWVHIFNAYGVPNLVLGRDLFDNSSAIDLFNSIGPAAFILPLDPQQTYFPKVTSKVLPNGKMESNPLHLMTPDLSESEKEKFFKFLPIEFWS